MSNHCGIVRFEWDWQKPNDDWEITPTDIMSWRLGPLEVEQEEVEAWLFVNCPRLIKSLDSRGCDTRASLMDDLGSRIEEAINNFFGELTSEGGRSPDAPPN